MTHETWLVIAAGAGFFLLGIAASPIGWAALLHRRTRSEQESERQADELGQQMRAVQARLDRCEATLRSLGEAPGGSGNAAASDRLPATTAWRWSAPHPGPPGEAQEPRLIAIPRLPAVHDRAAMHSGISQRYAAIWELAETGASVETIARASGQPIGQIELILGLRRQMDAPPAGG